MPLKPAARGKSRLGADEALVRAIGLDTVAAASAAATVARVVVVTADADTAAALAGHPRVVVVADAGGGLNAAVAQGMAAAGEAVDRAALLGDLPALRPDELDAALAQAAAHERAVVPDAEGSGSTLVTARAGTPWASAFGAGSHDRHLALGCATLPVPATAGLRRDVDTGAQLRAVSALVGEHTRAALTDGSGAPVDHRELQARLAALPDVGRSGLPYLFAWVTSGRPSPVLVSLLPRRDGTVTAMLGDLREKVRPLTTDDGTPRVFADEAEACAWAWGRLRTGLIDRRAPTPEEEAEAQRSGDEIRARYARVLEEHGDG
ncbi:NTP transferase domain-containing protein [Microbacterium sp. GXF7504]